MGSEVGGRVSEVSEVGEKGGGIGSEVYGINLVCLDSDVACSCARVGEVVFSIFFSDYFELM